MECLRAFHAHPATAGQTYLQHMGFAVRFGLSLLGAGAAAIVHGLVPCWFQTTASRTVKMLYGRLHDRASEPDARLTPRPPREAAR